MTTIWVLIVWLASGPFASWSYDTERECLRAADQYKRAVCKPFVVPKGAFLVPAPK